jgi:hypothetical protein
VLLGLIGVALAAATLALVVNVNIVISSTDGGCANFEADASTFASINTAASGNGPATDAGDFLVFAEEELVAIKSELCADETFTDVCAQILSLGGGNEIEPMCDQHGSARQGSSPMVHVGNVRGAGLSVPPFILRRELQRCGTN